MIICLPLTFAGESTTPMPESTRLVCKGSSNGLTTHYAPHTHPHPQLHFLDGGKLSVGSTGCLLPHDSLLTARTLRTRVAPPSSSSPFISPISPLYLPNSRVAPPSASSRRGLRSTRHSARWRHAGGSTRWRHAGGSTRWRHAGDSMSSMSGLGQAPERRCGLYSTNTHEPCHQRAGR